MQARITLGTQYRDLPGMLSDFTPIHAAEENGLMLAEYNIEKGQLQSFARYLTRLSALVFARYCKELLDANRRHMYPPEISELARRFSLARPRLKTAEIEAYAKAVILRGDIFPVDGYLRFVQRGVRQTAARLMARLAESIVTAREYEEFIALMQRYVANAPSKSNLVHIMFDNGLPVVLKEDFLPYYHPHSLPEAGDSMLGLLLDLVPHKILVHGEENCPGLPVMDTVFRVFAGRVSYSSAQRQV